MMAPGAMLDDESAGIDRAPSRWRTLRAQPYWRWVTRAAATAFLLAVAALIFIEARKVDWGEVAGAIRRMPWGPLVTAIGLAWTSQLLYSCYDLLGRHYTGHTLRTAPVMAANFVSYAFNLNLGYLVGGAAIRLRLYHQLGIGVADIARILTFSVLTNWLGYLVLAGVLLIMKPVELPFGFVNAAGVHQVAGVILLLLPIGYLAACAWSKRRVVQLRGHRLTLPSFRMAVLQIVLSASNWAVMGGVIYTLLLQRVDYPAVLCTLLVAAVAGLISHVPAGIGVLEAVFVTLLPFVAKEELLAVLLVYRGIYYLIPLLVAAAVYFAFEARLKYQRAQQAIIAEPRM
jgi:uncharacterized membrane protein YbhN (UPF0104 family)